MFFSISISNVLVLKRCVSKVMGMDLLKATSKCVCVSDGKPLIPSCAPVNVSAPKVKDYVFTENKERGFVPCVCR